MMNKTQFPEEKRPLTPEEVAYLEREAVVYERWRRFYAVMSFPFVPVGVVAMIGAVYSLVFGSAIGVNSMQAFIVGMFVSIAGFTPLYLTFAMRDRRDEVRAILKTYPRAEESPAQPDE